MADLLWLKLKRWVRSCIPDPELERTLENIQERCDIDAALCCLDNNNDNNSNNMAAIKKFVQRLSVFNPKTKWRISINLRGVARKHNEENSDILMDESSYLVAHQTRSRLRIDFAKYTTSCWSGYENAIEFSHNQWTEVFIQAVLDHVARRYKDISEMIISFGGPLSWRKNEAAPMPVSLHSLLAPFAAAGHWTTSLKVFRIINLDLSLGSDDHDELESYPESLERMMVIFSEKEEHSNANATIFKLMDHSKALKDVSGCGRCGIMTPLAVKYMCKSMLKTPHCHEHCRFLPAVVTLARFPWYDMYTFVSAKNRDAMQAELSKHCVHVSHVELPPNNEWQSLVVSVAYHYATLERFRVLLEGDDKGKAAKLIPLFLQRLQKNRGDKGFEPGNAKLRLIHAIVHDNVGTFAGLRGLAAAS